MEKDSWIIDKNQQPIPSDTVRPSVRLQGMDKHTHKKTGRVWWTNNKQATLTRRACNVRGCEKPTDASVQRANRLVHTKKRPSPMPAHAHTPCRKRLVRRHRRMLERQPPLPLSLLSPSLSPCYSMLGNVEGHSFPIVYLRIRYVQLPRYLYNYIPYSNYNPAQLLPTWYIPTVGKCLFCKNLGLIITNHHQF